MAAHLGNFSVEDVENRLCQIKNIKAARIIKDEENNIEEIHILALPNKGPKQLVRDIESALIVEYGIPINHRKISIAQIENDEISNNGNGKQKEEQEEKQEEKTEKKTEKDKSRLKIININADTRDTNVKVKVVLGINQAELEGLAEGSVSKSGRMRLVSMAALDAINKSVNNQSCNFVVEDVGIFNLAHERIAVACVAAIDSSGEQIYSGSAVVKKNEKDAIVRATLDAINRRLNFLFLTTP
jgi:hypothetical protein